MQVPLIKPRPHLKNGFLCHNNFSEERLHLGFQVIAVAKSSDVVLMVLDASKVHIRTLWSVYEGDFACLC